MCDCCTSHTIQNCSSGAVGVYDSTSQSIVIGSTPAVHIMQSTETRDFRKKASSLFCPWFVEINTFYNTLVWEIGSGIADVLDKSSMNHFLEPVTDRCC